MSNDNELIEKFYAHLYIFASKYVCASKTEREEKLQAAGAAAAAAGETNALSCCGRARSANKWQLSPPRQNITPGSP